MPLAAAGVVMGGIGVARPAKHPHKFEADFIRIVSPR